MIAFRVGCSGSAFEQADCILVVHLLLVSVWQIQEAWIIKGRWRLGDQCLDLYSDM